MFSLDEFIADCQQAITEAEPKTAVKKVVEKAIADPVGFKAAIMAKGKSASLKEAILFHSDSLTILPASTSPGMVTPAHDHQMWAVIGIIEGIEPNDFYLDGEEGLKKQSSKMLEAGDVVVIEGKTIHSISNPLDVQCFAIHVYGGDLVEQEGRSMWNPHTLEREPYDIIKLGTYIAELTAASQAQ